jgi:hypothetical protein
MSRAETNHLYVLIIGVGNNAAFGGGAANLEGAAPDACLMKNFVRGSQFPNVPEANVHCLAVDQAGEVAMGPDGSPTKQAILAAVTWLGERMAASAAAGVRPSAMVTYSGHGFAPNDIDHHALGTSLAIVPTDAHRDVDGRALGALYLQDVVGEIAVNYAHTEDVTWVIDACYSVLDAAVDTLVEHEAASGRFLMGSRPWEDAYEVFGLDNPHGAFTFAFVTMLEQWCTTDADGVRYVQVSYGELMFRIRGLLDVLGLKQRPMLVGMPRVALLPFLKPGTQVAKGLTTPVPNRPRPREQVDPEVGGFSVLQLTVRTEVMVQGTLTRRWRSLGQVLQASSDHTYVYSINGESKCFDFEAGQEYWYLTTSDKGLLITSGDVLSPFDQLHFKRLFDDQTWTDLATHMPVGVDPKTALRFTEFDTWTVASGLKAACDAGQAMTGICSTKPAVASAPTALFAVFEPVPDDASQERLRRLVWLSNTSATEFLGGLVEDGDPAKFRKPVAPGSNWMGWAQDFGIAAPVFTPEGSGISAFWLTTGSGATPAFEEGNTFRYALAYVETVHSLVTVGPMSEWSDKMALGSGGSSVNLAFTVNNLPSGALVRIYRQVLDKTHTFVDDHCIVAGASVVNGALFTISDEQSTMSSPDFPASWWGV